jgi:hypothetical protein
MNNNELTINIGGEEYNVLSFKRDSESYLMYVDDNGSLYYLNNLNETIYFKFKITGRVVKYCHNYLYSIRAQIFEYNNEDNPFRAEIYLK